MLSNPEKLLYIQAQIYCLPKIVSIELSIGEDHNTISYTDISV